MTQDVLGELFDMSQPLANRWIHLLIPILKQALAELGELPSRGTDPAPITDSDKPLSNSQESIPFFS